MKEFKGQLKGFPKEVVKKMLKRQVQQGNKKDVSVFEKDSRADNYEGGFSWGKDNDIFDAASKGDFDPFFERYPKKVKKDKEMDRINRWAKLVSDSIGDLFPEQIKQITLDWDNKKDVLVDTNINDPIKEEPKEKPFPKLMKGEVSGTVVLFTEQEIGTVVIVGMPIYELGLNYDNWNMSVFQDCEIQVK